MAYTYRIVGESLASLVTQATYDAVHKLEREIAHQAQDVMLTTAQAATPVRYGTLRDSWLALPLWPHGPDRYGATIRNDHWTAAMINYGTQAHDVRPKGRARGGKRALPEALGPRASAHVRGIQAHHMTEKAVDTVGAVIGDVSYPAQRRFKDEAEFAIARAKRERLLPP